MALIKILDIGEELVFNLDGETISIVLTEKAGRQAVLKITANKSVRISTIGKDKVWVGIPS